MKRLPSPLPAADHPGASTSAAGRAAVRSLQLANGLKLIVWPDSAIPNVALYNWVRVGSRNEAEGRTGLAHFFEHMMFNGTARRAAGEFDALMEAQGGANNAFTSDDVTVYQDWFPRGALELVLELEADRLTHLAFDARSVESERRVVYSERQLRVEDNNAALLSERVQAAAFSVHPYRFPTIGWPSDMRAWQLEDLRRFFQTYYAANNQTLVLAGDVAPEQAFALARRHLAQIPGPRPVPPVRAREPAQRAERRVVLRRRAHAPLLQHAYRAPAAADPRGPAVLLLLLLLIEGDGSRLHRKLVEEHKLVVEVSGHWHEGIDPALFWIHLTLPQDADTKRVEHLLDVELARVAGEGVTAAEVARARNLATAHFWKQLATIDGRAHLIGEYESLRFGWRGLFSAPERLAAVAREEIRSVARAILDPRQRTVGVLLPSCAP